VISDRPFVRPLEMLQAEYPCTLALLVDPGAARLVHVYLGQAAELERLRSMPVTGSDMDSSIAAYTREAVEHAREVWRQQPCDHVMIAGSKDAREALRESLPEDMLAQLVGEADLSPLVTLEAVRDRVLALDEERQQEDESRHVQEFLAAIEHGGAAVAGLEQTLLAVRSKKVRLLLVEAGFHQAGGACPNCGYLGEGQEGKCLVCEMALRPEPDLVEAAMQQVMENGGEIEVLRSPQARGALQAHGDIGALLFDRDHPPVKNRSNDRILSKGGNINEDALHDEAMDESFPASDPPSY
jgi:stalled ribosome rescue protein Dom34